MTCALCDRAMVGPILAQNEDAVAVPDGFPISPGHSLILSRRHQANLFDLSPRERQAIFDLLVPVKQLLEGRHHPDGFNVGVNVGAAAGQTVEHVHVHVIPRFRGDVEDPRGGVRWVLPAKAKYWK